MAGSLTKKFTSNPYARDQFDKFLFPIDSSISLKYTLAINDRPYRTKLFTSDEIASIQSRDRSLGKSLRWKQRALNCNISSVNGRRIHRRTNSSNDSNFLPRFCTRALCRKFTRGARLLGIEGTDVIANISNEKKYRGRVVAFRPCRGLRNSRLRNPVELTAGNVLSLQETKHFHGLRYQNLQGRAENLPEPANFGSRYLGTSRKQPLHRPRRDQEESLGTFVRAKEGHSHGQVVDCFTTIVLVPPRTPERSQGRADRHEPTRRGATRRDAARRTRSRESIHQGNGF